MISRGVAAGARMPCMEPASSSGLPVSAMVGTSGTAGERCRPVTARPRSWPPRITVAAADSDVTMIGVWPPTAELIAGPPPLNGTCTRSRPCLSLNSSPTSRTCVAAPDEAKRVFAGIRLHHVDQLLHRLAPGTKDAPTAHAAPTPAA